jgi:hypothetical protein
MGGVPPPDTLRTTTGPGLVAAPAVVDPKKRRRSFLLGQDKPEELPSGVKPPKAVKSFLGY